MANLVSTILSWVMDLGYFGIMLGLMVEVIPSEIVLAYGGYLVSKGEITIVGSVIAGTIGGVFSQLFLYWLGYYGGRPVLDKYGKYLLIKKHHLDVAENWFNKYGVGVIFTARFIPVVRHAISIPAGIAKMSVWKFIIYTTLAIIPWSILFIMLGIQLGNRWDQIGDVASKYTTPLAIAAVVLILLYFLFNMRKKR
ncbi:DedA family protein [Tepidibacillus fermentans]|uniref:Membrane protein DedA with SNARE-associated domain n=1 Tax=Tepidibacillus fermentans TaxID=1281767 RepID=A0A4R3KIM7_9BACI|nr:DedA family protein [Tepidibacillus fermentans]TCS83467.1 membrane protein DedA with SNARE-associated domain [Tepidibacillus fermentans]